MSASYQDRVDNWKRWLAVAREAVDAIEFGRYNDEVVPVGYEHWCGSATLAHDWNDYDGQVCSGCRSIIASPEGECDPLFSLMSIRNSLTF
jgi:hypothetical protein